MKKLLRLIRDFWIYFKAGHTKYLAFFLSISSFIVLQYRLVIEYIPQLGSVINSLLSFTFFFVVVYIPAAVLFGIFDYKKGEMRRSPQLSPYVQAVLTSDILLRNALISFIDGDIDRARNLMNESNKEMKEWLKK
jgi:hypothetical protein